MKLIFYSICIVACAITALGCAIDDGINFPDEDPVYSESELDSILSSKLHRSAPDLDNYEAFSGRYFPYLEAVYRDLESSAECGDVDKKDFLYFFHTRGDLILVRIYPRDYPIAPVENPDGTLSGYLSSAPNAKQAASCYFKYTFHDSDTDYREKNPTGNFLVYSA